MEPGSPSLLPHANQTLSAAAAAAAARFSEKQQVTSFIPTRRKPMEREREKERETSTELCWLKFHQRMNEPKGSFK
ncbi:hypothetical protein QQF64_032754 [Cirrhinus molitorella]|uniref:Uncharacterized protein n=1 Tax=Cirrhinus molitorella TaxID=172907 RepID=A0ABR3MRY5_9TELE